MKNKNAYTGLAGTYDYFMKEVPYDKWGSFIVDKLKGFGIDDGLVCDLGCGSGTITTYLANKGYDMTGIDSSNDMLQKALEKKGDRKILYLQQDMTAFELYGTMRAMVSTGDALNYITDKPALKKVFALVNNYLDPGGVFIFDMHTPAYYAGLGNGTYGDSEEDAAYVWTNSYNRATGMNECELTLFNKLSGDKYRRSEERHIQRAYSKGYITRIIKKAGLELVDAKADYTDKNARNKSHRIVYITIKPAHVNSTVEMDNG